MYNTIHCQLTTESSGVRSIQKQEMHADSNLSILRPADFDDNLVPILDLKPPALSS